MHHGGTHCEEGEDEGDEGLALRDQVPAGTQVGGVGGRWGQMLWVEPPAKSCTRVLTVSVATGAINVLSEKTINPLIFYISGE